MSVRDSDHAAQWPDASLAIAQDHIGRNLRHYVLNAITLREGCRRLLGPGNSTSSTAGHGPWHSHEDPFAAARTANDVPNTRLTGDTRLQLLRPDVATGSLPSWRDNRALLLSGRHVHPLMWSSGTGDLALRNLDLHFDNPTSASCQLGVGKRLPCEQSQQTISSTLSGHVRRPNRCRLLGNLPPQL